jgi:hypothetical protein
MIATAKAVLRTSINTVPMLRLALRVCRRTIIFCNAWLFRGRDGVVSSSGKARLERHKPGIPIIFLHVGESWFLDITLRQAALASPNSDIIFLTDAERPNLPGIIQMPVGAHHRAASEFKKLYRHASTNYAKYELLCFTRWFYIRDFVRLYGIDRFCMIDSDVMLFSPIELFAAEFGNHPAGNWSAANLITSLDVLDTICGHFEAVFKNRRFLSKIVDKYGVVSDMTALLDLASGNPTFFNQQNLPAKGFDNNISTSSDGLYMMDGKTKSLIVGSDGIPRARRASDGVEVPFHFLHFQGDVKALMPRFAWSRIQARKYRRHYFPPVDRGTYWHP